MLLMQVQSSYVYTALLRRVSGLDAMRPGLSPVTLPTIHPLLLASGPTPAILLMRRSPGSTEPR